MRTNRILEQLPPNALARLEPHLHPRSLKLRDLIEREGEPQTAIVFPLSGIISVVTGPAGDEIEVSVIGRSEMTGSWAFLGRTSAPTSSFVQIEGEAVSTAWSDLSLAMAEHPVIHRTCLLGVAASMEQMAGTAWANARSTVVERLARWLILCSQRTDGDQLMMTHEFLSTMLGVRRAGVTLALQTLEGDGVIKNTRGRIIIRDWAMLLEVGERAQEDGGQSGLPPFGG